MKGWGPKVRYVPSKPAKPNFFGGISRDFAGTSLRKKKAHKLKKIVGTPAGSPWDTWRDKQGSTGRCPRDFLLTTVEKTDLFAGTPTGCPSDTWPSKGFSEILCDFVLLFKRGQTCTLQTCTLFSARILALTASRLPSHAFFPPPSSLFASTLSESKWEITIPKKGQAMQRYHEEQSARSKGARLSPLDMCLFYSLILGVLEKFEKEKFVFKFWPLNQESKDREKQHETNLKVFKHPFLPKNSHWHFQKTLHFRNARVTPAPHIQGKTMNKHPD